MHVGFTEQLGSLQFPNTTSVSFNLQHCFGPANFQPKILVAPLSPTPPNVLQKYIPIGNTEYIKQLNTCTHYGSVFLFHQYSKHNRKTQTTNDIHVQWAYSTVLHFQHAIVYDSLLNSIQYQQLSDPSNREPSLCVFVIYMYMYAYIYMYMYMYYE